MLFRRAHGVASAAVGYVEAMMHRRLPSQGWPPLGLPEALNDTLADNDKMLIFAAASLFSDNNRRLLQARLEHPLRAMAVNASASMPLPLSWAAK